MDALPSTGRVTSPGRFAWLLRWNAGQSKTALLCTLVLGVCIVVLLMCLQQIWAQYGSSTAGHPAAFGDFLALWSYGKIAGAHPPAELYDPALLHARQVVLGLNPGFPKPFPYPPLFILLTWPLGLMRYDMAYLVWTTGTLALFVWSVVKTCSRLPVCVLGVIVAPATAATIVFGQSGCLAAALIISGVRLAGSRPVLSGILIGLLTYKPQVGFLVPVALASAGLWVAFAAAAVTVVGLAVVSNAAFGWAVWPAWLSMLPAYTENSDQRLIGLKPTVIANLQMLGVDLSVARMVQVAVALGVVVVVWRCFRRGPTRLATAALLVGTFLATPHAFVYDMPMVVAAVALFIQARVERGSVFQLGEIAILVLGLMFPAVLLLTDFAWPISSVCLLLLFGLMVRQEKAPASLLREGGGDFAGAAVAFHDGADMGADLHL